MILLILGIYIVGWWISVKLLIHHDDNTVSNLFWGLLWPFLGLSFLIMAPFYMEGFTLRGTKFDSIIRKFFME